MLDGKLWMPEVAKSTHYHAYWVHPDWVNEMKRIYRLGVHTFYRPRALGRRLRRAELGRRQDHRGRNQGDRQDVAPGRAPSHASGQMASITNNRLGAAIRPYMFPRPPPLVARGPTAFRKGRPWRRRRRRALRQFRAGARRLVILICGCLIGMIGFGPRSALGLFLTPMSQSYGWGRDVFALALAIQMLLWGAAQPFAGAHRRPLRRARACCRRARCSTASASC